MFPADQIVNVELDLSVHANNIVKIINEVKEIDPVMAGRFHEQVTKYIKENTQTTTVFSLKELAEYGYIK